MSTRTERQSTCPRFIVCEDGREYLERFERFFSSDFEFITAADYAAVLARIERDDCISGILLDLDFRRASTTRLVNEHGQPLAHTGKESVALHVANQGLFILSSLREHGIALPVLLFADIDDPQQREHIEHTFRPLELIRSHVSMGELKIRLSGLGRAAR